MKTSSIAAVLIAGGLLVGAVVAVTYRTPEERIADDNREVEERHKKYLAREAARERARDGA